MNKGEQSDLDQSLSDTLSLAAKTGRSSIFFNVGASSDDENGAAVFGETIEFSESK